jgi:hypothetical protein
MGLIAQGTRPAIVLESRSKDEQYLRRRGIKELVKLRLEVINNPPHAVSLLQQSCGIRFDNWP